MRRKAHPHEHQGELNIVPYLDIMVNLVMFMLMSMTGFVSFQMLNVNLPSIGISNSNDQPPPPTEEKLNLTVIMAPKGFYIAAKGGTLPPSATGVAADDAASMNPGETQPTIPTKGGVDYEYDYDKLANVMGEIRKVNPGVSQYYLSPDRMAKYDSVVKTMDCVRPAFADVAFAALKMN